MIIPMESYTTCDFSGGGGGDLDPCPPPSGSAYAAFQGLRHKSLKEKKMEIKPHTMDYPKFTASNQPDFISACI